VIDSNSRIAWHRAQLRRNRDALKALERMLYTIGHDKLDQTEKAIAELQRKIAESEKCVIAHDRQSRRPLGTDFGCLTNVSWGSWSAHNG
jgi:hypothetical protein